MQRIDSHTRTQHTPTQHVQRIDSIRKTGNSIGGVVECIVRNVPSGLGSPVFDKLEGELAKVSEWVGPV